MKRHKNHYRKNKQQQVSIPNNGYKYSSIDNWDYYFRDWTIRFTPPDDLNDPFECSPHSDTTGYSGGDEQFIRDAFQPSEYKDACLDMYHSTPECHKYTEEEFMIRMEHIYQEYERCNGKNKITIEELMWKSETLLKNETGCFCMSKRKDNLLMWSHYANAHNGFVIQFDLKSDFFSKRIDYFGQTIGDVCPVTYKKKRVSKPVNKIKIKRDYFLTKSNDWQYEQELRIFVPLNAAEFAWIEQETKGVVRIPKIIVQSVIFGAGMRDGEINNKCETIRSQPGCEHIVFQKASLHPKKYALVITDI